ncbi:MAG: 2Fe-2S iron-sulfur cluster binding domain-containing protein [Deltaproteobacteria bacterium]|nr:2Fe-2S iron-sulfur cluster binding domain-containing protein [Deltaproteobacteria bacterium]
MDDHDDTPKPLVSRRQFLKGGALTTAALSSGVLTVEPAEAGRVPEAVPTDPRRSPVALQVNGVPYRVEVANRTTLLQLVREELALTGTKMGCDRAQCGACTVLLNGRAVYAQCGYCTSGQILATKALLDRVPTPTEAQARQALAGNLCRCAAYKRILASVLAAARLLQAGGRG